MNCFFWFSISKTTPTTIPYFLYALLRTLKKLRAARYSLLISNLKFQRSNNDKIARWNFWSAQSSRSRGQKSSEYWSCYATMRPRSKRWTLELSWMFLKNLTLQIYVIIRLQLRNTYPYCYILLSHWYESFLITSWFLSFLWHFYVIFLDSVKISFYPTVTEAHSLSRDIFISWNLVTWQVTRESSFQKRNSSSSVRSKPYYSLLFNISVL